MLTILLLLMVHSSHSRLSIVSSTETQTLIKSGEEATLWCKSDRPWFLCLWKGPNGLAMSKTMGQQNSDTIRSPESRHTLIGTGNICRLNIRGITPEDEGEYSCNLVDKEDVQTVTRNIHLEVGVRAIVKWTFSSSPQYAEDRKVVLTCTSTGGHPKPSLVIRKQGDIDLNEEPSYSEEGLVTRIVSIDGITEQNNSTLSCHAEQRGPDGDLIYNSTLASLRLDELSTLALYCSNWWCGWEIIIFVVLVLGLFLLVAFCGIYFFCATRKKPYTVIMYNSEEIKESHSSFR